MTVELRYPDIARASLERVVTEQAEAIDAAARLIVDAYRRGGILQTFGTGHSRIVTLELSGRAGGLAAVGMLAVKDLVMFGGTEPAQILDPTFEREPGFARRIYDLAEPRPEDAFVIVSNSGINAAVVEMALLVKEREHPLIALTSVAHTSSVEVRHTAGRRLIDMADVVLDNCAPRGDAALELAPGLTVGAVSSLTGVLIAQLLTESVCRHLLAAKLPVPALVSANVPEGDQHNRQLIDQLANRVRPIEP